MKQKIRVLSFQEM